MNNIYAYVRANTKEQNADKQHEALKQYSVYNNIEYTATFEDIAIGKDFERPQYKALKKIIKQGDTLIIKELDRLEYNIMDTPKELQYFFEKNINVKILDTPLVSTGDNKLDSTIKTMLISLLSYITGKEKEKLQGKVIEGLKNAKDNDVEAGRSTRSLPKNFKKYYCKWKNRELTGVKFAKLLNISRATLYRDIKEYQI